MFRKLVLLSCVSLVVMHIYNLVTMMDLPKNVVNSGLRKCYAVPGISDGSEDIQVIHEMQVAIVSSGWPHQPQNIYMVRLDKLDALNAEPFTFDEPFDKESFHPHGLYIRKSRLGPYYLYVVNHHKKFECVDVFEINFENVTLLHLKRIIDPTMRHLNDVVAVDDFVLYYTNWLATHGRVLNMLEIALRLHLGDVSFYDGNSGRVVATNLFIPNGLTVTPDGKFIYVGLTGTKAIVAYERQSDNNLKLVKQYDLPSGVDNLDVAVAPDSSYILWFTGPYHILKSALRLFGFVPDMRAPSFISRFDIGRDGTLSNLHDVLTDDGNMIIASSQGVHYKDHVLVGTVDTFMHACKYE